MTGAREEEGGGGRKEEDEEEGRRRRKGEVGVPHLLIERCTGNESPIR